MYTERVGSYKLLRYLLSLPMLPAAHMRPAFDTIAASVTDPRIQTLVQYVRTTWFDNRTWTVDDLSIFKCGVRTNNDVEGWHRRLNGKARHGHLQLYELIQLVRKEASIVQLQLVLLGEGKLKRYTRRRYADINDGLDELWQQYEAGQLSTTKLLRRCARLQLPFGL